jgi:hypothetical protein
MSRAYLCVSVDTTCDEGHSGGARRPLAAGGVDEAIVRRLAPLFALHGAKPTYLVAATVLRDERARDALRRLGTSLELGTLGDDAPDAATERASLTALTDLFILTQGHLPQSFRASGFALGRTSIALLEDLGYQVDASVTPGVRWARADRAPLDYEDAPTQPYHPDLADVARRGDARLLEVPVTVRRRVGGTLPLVGSHFAPRWLRPSHASRAGGPHALVEVAEDEMADARRRAPGRPVILHATLATADVAPSRVTPTEAAAHATLARLGALLAFARREGVAVVGLGDVPEILGR